MTATAHRQEFQPRESETASFLSARLNLTRAELQITREQKEILRHAVTMLREFVASPPRDAGPVLARIDSVLEITK